jgi:hypothetical protein
MYFNFLLFAIAISGFYKITGLLLVDVGLNSGSLTLLNLSLLPN